MVVFEKPIGAHGDVKELEYISSLHQTQPDHLRADGSIDSEDISLYLLSRHGIKLEPEFIEKRILDGEHQLDLVQVLCMLLAPELLKRASDQDGDLFSRVHQIVMGDFRGDVTAQPTMNTETLREMMEIYGEFDIDDAILEEMLTSLNSPDNSFTADTFKNALIGDIEQYYSIKWKDKLSTHYDDVRLSSPGHQLLDSQDDKGEQGLIRSKVVLLESKLLLENLKNGTVKSFQKFSSLVRGESDDSSNDEDDICDIESTTPMTLPDRVFTAAAIDQVADTYRSLKLSNLLWVTFVVSYLAYLWQIDSDAGQYDCSVSAGETASFGCLLANSITRWLLIFAQLSLVGTSFFFLASLGNDTYTTNRCHSIGFTLLSMFTIFLFTCVTYFVGFDAYIIDTNKKQGFRAVYLGALFLGLLLLVFQCIHLLRLLYPDPKLMWVDSLLTPSTTKAEVHIKHAADFKTSKIIDNALAMHDDTQNLKRSTAHGRSLGTSRNGAFGNAVMNYQLAEGVTEPAGGLWWAWKRYWSGAIEYEDGVWIHSRLVASNFAQWFVCFGILFAGAYVVDNYGETLVEESKKVTNSSTVNYDFADIKPWQFRISASIGLVVGFLAAVRVTVIYIPSFISTVLAFRSGANPSLKDREFLKHRYAEDNATLLFGCALWGALFTGLISFLVVSGFFFVFLWEETRNRALSVLAQVLGICVTYTLKILVLLFLRSTFFRAFYRTRPAASNIMGVVMECWNLGLSPGFIAARAGQIFGMAVIYIGRMDVDFLAKGVATFGPVSFDTYSQTFRKDLLVHEAHRHPYIERLGVFYLLKLRYGKPFMTLAGTYWRILFTLALMPWMRKYRVLRSRSTEEIDKQMQQCAMELEIELEAGGETSRSIRRGSLGRLQSLQKLKGEQSLRLIQYPTTEAYLEAQIEQLRAQNVDLMQKLARFQAKDMHFVLNEIDEVDEDMETSNIK